MAEYPKVILKPEREKPLKNFHPWVFLGAVESLPSFENGAILQVESARGEFLGYGYFNQGQSIVGRMFSFKQEDPMESFQNSVKAAVALRKNVISEDTTAFRVINGEGDNLPGLIVDQYGDVLVVQINTLGMEKLKPFWLPQLTQLTGIESVYEKSNSPTRRKEGLKDFSGWLSGKHEEVIEVVEHGLKFIVDFSTAQKTGLFLDHREMRQLVRGYANGKTVLNCFGYTGGFSVYALAGGAVKADTVDLDADATALAQRNVSLNGFSETDNGFFSTDVFEFLSNRTRISEYDFIILDPPAFAKRSSDIANASRGYRELNRQVFESIPSGGLLLTSSCSAHIDLAMFQNIIFQAAKHARRKVKVLSFHVLAPDHPMDLYYPEGNYLKSLLLLVE
jgi:23S rRNA (cytosine1962-C5)-methyltransferase